MHPKRGATVFPELAGRNQQPQKMSTHSQTGEHSKNQGRTALLAHSFRVTALSTAASQLTLIVKRHSRRFLYHRDRLLLVEDTCRAMKGLR
jgi:hypothetical protein